jgi:hypothetical protein
VLTTIVSANISKPFHTIDDRSGDSQHLVVLTEAAFGPCWTVPSDTYSSEYEPTSATRLAGAATSGDSGRFDESIQAHHFWTDQLGFPGGATQQRHAALWMLVDRRSSRSRDQQATLPDRAGGAGY